MKGAGGADGRNTCFHCVFLAIDVFIVRGDVATGGVFPNVS